MSELQLGTVIRGERVDATAMRENMRQRRLLRLALVLLVPLAYVWYRELTGDPVQPEHPEPVRRRSVHPRRRDDDDAAGAG